MNETTAALACLLVVLVVAAMANRLTAVLTSLVLFAGFNFFFLPPIGTFAIAKEDDLVALFALLAVSLIGSHLSYEAKRRADEALALAKQRNEADMARRGAEIKSALVASFSHDLKTPLTALKVATGNLHSPALSDEERREQLQIMETELERLKRLFDNVAEMAGLETRAVRAELEWVQPEDIIDAARRQAEGILSSHDVQIAGASDLLVHVDPRLTSASLAHVLENAAAYSSPTAPITIEMNVEPHRLILSVRDRGPGLPTNPEQVFERFHRGATSNDRFGTGMGLAITRGLLAVQGGRIGAANHPDGGAVFTLDIPVTTRPAAEMALDVA
jgi:two-component system, OmpR family, sensor histidine kinase KdpD